MSYPIHRKFIAAVAAAAIVITGFSAAPARADNDDVGRALAALAGLAVLGVIIKNAREDHKKPQTLHRNNVYGKGHWQGQGYGRDDRHGLRPRPLPPRANRKLLPQQCLRSVEGRNGRLRVFGRRCLERNYRFAQRLPGQCVRRFYTDGGRRIGFEARCLRDFGYQLARH